MVSSATAARCADAARTRFELKPDVCSWPKAAVRGAASIRSVLEVKRTSADVYEPQFHHKTIKLRYSALAVVPVVRGVEEC